MPENPSRSPPTIGTQVTAFAKRIKRKVRKAVSFRRNSWIQPNSREGGNRWRFRDGKPCKELPGTQMGPPVLIQVWAFFFGGFKHLINQNSLPNNMDESPPKDEQKFWNHLFFNMFFFFFPTKWLASSGMFSGCQRVGPSELKQRCLSWIRGMMGMMFPQNHHQNPDLADFFFVGGKKKGKKTPFWRKLILKDRRKLSNLDHLCKGLGVRQHEFLANGAYWSVSVATAPTPTLQEYQQQIRGLNKKAFQFSSTDLQLMHLPRRVPIWYQDGP